MACNWKGGGLMCQYTWQERAAVAIAIICYIEAVILFVMHPITLVIGIAELLIFVTPAPTHQKD